MSFRKHRRPKGSLGLVVRRIRRRLDFSQVELATSLGWPAYLISGYEEGKFGANVGRLVQLLRIANPEERGPILKLLEVHGVLASDLALATVDCAGAISVSAAEAEDGNTAGRLPAQVQQP